jgi:hypothetical protein
MKNRLLLSQKWLWPALILFILGGLMSVLNLYGGWELSWLDVNPSKKGFFVFNDYNLTNEFGLSFTLIGLIAFCFIRVNNEDEFVYQNRLLSWQWSVLINYTMLFLATWLLYGDAFISVMVFSMVSIPLIFLIRFYYILFRMRHHEE